MPRFAGLVRRGLALGLDVLLFGAFSLPLLLLHQALLTRIDGLAAWNPIILPVLNWLLPLLITLYCWCRFLGTPGKLLLGCQLVDARSFQPLSPGQALLRYLGYLLALLPLGLGLLWIIWDRRKQGFHDKLAGSVVIIESELPSLASLEETLG